MLRSSIVALALSGAVMGRSIQKQGLQVPAQYKGQANVVRQMFNTSYATYTKYAYGHDDLSPISESYNDPRNGWGATIADALSTMIIMGGFEPQIEAAVKHFAGINFNESYTSDTTSLFETTIRYVGGFLSAYELSNYQYPILVTKAKQITDKLVHGFDGAVGVPYGYVNFTSNQPTITTSNVAEAGTLTLEWTRLSQYTFNQTYARLSQNSAKHIAALPAPYPGLPGQGIDPSTGNFTDTYVTWGGGTDSYLEYLIKFARISNTLDPTYSNTWKTAVDSSIKYLQSQSTVGNWTYLLDSPEPGYIEVTGSNLECFHAGNWIMGGSLLNNQSIVDFGLLLADACWNTYSSTETGIGPEVFSWEAVGYPTTAPTGDDLVYYEKHGNYISDGYDYYDLRPEVLESNFYAWRNTGNTKYLDRAVSFVNSLNKYAAVNGAYAGFEGINNISNIAYFDNTESFFFAEVLKYLYLTFDDPTHISLDEWVFNTECHPLKAPAELPSYNIPGPFHAPVMSDPSKTHGPPGLAQPAVISPIPELPSNLKQLPATPKPLAAASPSAS